MSSCSSDVASYRLSNIDFFCRALLSFGFADHMDSGNLVGFIFFNPFIRDS